MEKQFVISRLARQTGYTPAMIRYFEKAGLITPAARTAARYRLFEPLHAEELRFVRSLQELGFHPQQIKALREVRLSRLPAPEKKEAVEKVLQRHREYVGQQARYFADLEERLQVAAADFVSRVLKEDC